MWTRGKQQLLEEQQRVVRVQSQVSVSRSLEDSITVDNRDTKSFPRRSHTEPSVEVKRHSFPEGSTGYGGSTEGQPNVRVEVNIRSQEFGTPGAQQQQQALLYEDEDRREPPSWSERRRRSIDDEDFRKSKRSETGIASPISPGDASPGAMSPGAMSPGAMSPGAMSPGAMSPGAAMSAALLAAGMSPSGAMSPMAAMSPPVGGPMVRTPLLRPPAHRGFMSPRTPTSPIRYSPGMLQRLRGRRSPSVTQRTPSPNLPWPFMSNRQILAARKFRKNRHFLVECIVTWVFVLTLAVVVLGVLVAYNHGLERLDGRMQEQIKILQRSVREPQFDDAVHREFIKGQNKSNDNVRTVIEPLLRQQMIAGRMDNSEENFTVPFFVYQTLKVNKFDKVRRSPHWVLLSKLPKNKNNKVEVLDQEGNVEHSCSDMEPELVGGAEMGMEPAFSPYGYTPPGEPQTTEPVIYGNRCLPDDLDYLDSISINYWGHILLCRYGPTQSPGLAVYTAQKKGARGVVFFPDPEDVAGYSNSFYPSNWWMPGGAIRREQVRRDQDIGDPSTPGYSSRSRGTHRIPQTEAGLPMIPVQPVGYDDAAMIMRKMTGRACPDKWSPHLEVACTIGDETAYKIRLTSTTMLQKLEIENVIGYLRGTVEPDRYVVFGVPMDSLSAGALMPGTAVSQFLELGRLLASQYKEWKPRRTVVLAAWDAFQFGSIGATEYVEGARHKMATRTVAYINTDICTSGPEYAMSGSPIFTAAFAKAIKYVRHGKDRRRSLYDSWVKVPGAADHVSGGPGLPMLRRTGSFLPFVHIAGIPSIDVAFGNNVSRGVYYPAMGTAYDTAYLLSHFVDQGYKVNHMCTQLLATLIRQWSDTPLLPYDLHALKSVLHVQFNELAKDNKDLIAKKGINFDVIHSAATKFGDTVDKFIKARDAIDMRNPLKVRMFNDKMMRVERSFVQEFRKDEKTTQFRNVVFGLADSDQERMTAYPMLKDMLQELKPEDHDHDSQLEVEKINRHASIVAHAIFQAARSLNLNAVF